ncbi:MAG: hypothetical protein KGL53_13430, partial [Elusimicrobia bacterium]|nr:hypothetical protein [Elusimicrobiota bacterium]
MRRTALLAALAVLLAPLAAAAAPVRRKVLVLYRRTLIPGKVKDLFFLDTHQHAEAVLNWLGLDLEYVDADATLPSPASLEDARGVLVWSRTTEEFRDPRPVCRWLGGAMNAGLKVVLLGQIGFQRRGASGPGGLDPECVDVLRSLGATYKALRAVGPLDVKTLLQDPRMLGFERKPDPTETGTLPLVGLSAGATPYVRLELDDDPNTVTAPVAVSPRGGLALNPFLLYSDTELSPVRYAWVVDPFAFFARAFALEGLPRPDPTTLNGLRLFMSHVDGDGFFNVSELDRHKVSGEVFTERFLAKRPDTPFTVSLIAGYFDLALYQDRATLALERAALVRPNVEPASHGYAHPFVWRTRKLALTIPGYSFDREKETVGSARLIERTLLPPGEKVGLYLWTGDCLPGAQDIAAVRAGGLLDLNGGGGFFDKSHPSVANLLPLSRQADGERQIYAPDNNEDVYTNLWTGPYYGFRDVIETFQNSGEPRRLKPVDVYVHYYSAERYAGVRALDEVYDWARRRPLNPQFTSVYAR